MTSDTKNVTPTVHSLVLVVGSWETFIPKEIKEENTSFERTAISSKAVRSVHGLYYLLAEIFSCRCRSPIDTDYGGQAVAVANSRSYF